MESTDRIVVRAACPHDCPDTCAMLVTVENGRAIDVRGAPDHPPTGGVLCTKVARYLDRTYSDQRVLYPMKRIGRKGEGRFRRISWDEALTTIATKFRAIAASSDGAQAILPYSYAGTLGLLQFASMDRRFFHRLGASLLDRTICSSAGKAGWIATIGAAVGTDVEQFENSRLILIWGSNAIASNLHFWTRAQEAKRRGARLIAIDPYRSATAEKCHDHVALLPGTDAALALGMMHVLIDEDLIDRDYIARYTVGFEALRERAADYPPARVATICGLRSEQVVDLARAYGTIKPASIRLNYGMQRHAGGGNAARAVACLPALVGSWRDPAGGGLLSSSGTYPVDSAALERPDLMRGRPRTVNMSAIGDALVDASDPPIRAIYVYNSNPVAVAPHSAKVAAGFGRDDLFCVVHEIFQTDTADYADILLPATTQLEQTDIHTSYGHLYVQANNAAIAPLGEAKPNTEVFRLLAARMGFDETCFRDSDDDLARQAFLSTDPRAAGIDWETLKKTGFQRLAVPLAYAPFAQGNFPTPSGKCEFASAMLAAQGQDPLPSFVPPRESVASNPLLARRFPLAFLSPPARNFLNSSFANLPAFVAEEKSPKLDLHTVDAQARGIATGDLVRIFNDRGSFTATARVGDRARLGVVVSPSIWWKKLSPDGANANAVTSQALTDLGRAATFYDCLVEVAKVQESSGPGSEARRLERSGAAGEQRFDFGALRLRVGVAEFDQRLAEAGREQQVGQERRTAWARAAHGPQQYPQRARKLPDVAKRDLVQHHAGRDYAQADVAKRNGTGGEPVGRDLPDGGVDQADLFQIGAQRVGEDARQDLPADLRHRRRRGLAFAVGAHAAARRADDQDAIGAEVQRRAGGRHLPHRAVAEVLAIDRSGRKDERNGARREQVRHADHRALADALRALPQVDAGRRLAERHRHPAAIAHRGDRQGVERAAAERGLDPGEGYRTRQKFGERRVVEEARRTAMPPRRHERRQPAPAGSGEAQGVGAIDVPGVEIAPELAQPRRRAQEIGGAGGDGDGVDGARRGSADDGEGNGLAGGKPAGYRMQDAGLIGGAGAATGENDRQLRSRGHPPIIMPTARHRRESPSRNATLPNARAPGRGVRRRRYSLRTSPTITPKISSAPSGRITGYALFSGLRMKFPRSRSSVLSVNCPSTMAMTMSPRLADAVFSTTTRSPSSMPASIIESPLTRTSTVCDGCSIR